MATNVYQQEDQSLYVYFTNYEENNVNMMCEILNKETGETCVIRELEEETGITKADIELFHMMDFVYYNQNCYVEVYVGYLEREVVLLEETHPLEWLPITENFFDMNRFAGEGNIGHMVEQVRQYGTKHGDMGVS